MASPRLLELLVVAACVPASGCTFFSSLFGGGGNQGAATTQAAGPSSDEVFLERIAEKRAAAEASPGDLDLATDYVAHVYAAATQGLYERNELDPQVRVRDALPVIQAVEGDDATIAQGKAVEAMLMGYLGETEAQGQLLEASYALDPNGAGFEGLLVWYRDAGRDEDIVKMCKSKRKSLDYSDALYIAMDACLAARGSSSVDEGLDFLKKNDRKWFEAERGRIQAEMAAARAEEDRRLAEARAREEAQRAAEAEARANQAASSSSSGGAAPSGPVSVTLRNRCRETVKVFFGDKPKFGSGRYSSMSSNSSTSHSFRPGDMFWIVDDSQNGLSSVTVSPGMREIEILDGCTGMRTR